MHTPKIIIHRLYTPPRRPRRRASFNKAGVAGLTVLLALLTLL